MQLSKSSSQNLWSQFDTEASFRIPLGEVAVSFSSLAQYYRSVWYFCIEYTVRGWYYCTQYTVTRKT